MEEFDIVKDLGSKLQENEEEISPLTATISRQEAGITSILTENKNLRQDLRNIKNWISKVETSKTDFQKSCKQKLEQIQKRIRHSFGHHFKIESRSQN